MTAAGPTIVAVAAPPRVAVAARDPAWVRWLLIGAALVMLGVSFALLLVINVLQRKAQVQRA